MNKFILVSVFAIAMIAGNAYSAVQKCVALDSTTTCTSAPNPYDRHADWGASCTTGSTTTAIKGIALCSDQNGQTQSSTSATISLGTAVDNKYCWCKMESPAVSLWVYDSSGSTADECMRYCAVSCALDVIDPNKPTFRSALFSGLGD